MQTQVSVFSGPANNKITSVSPLVLNKLFINKRSSIVTINHALTIQNELRFLSGKLDMNGYNIILAPAALINGETNETGITGRTGGEIEITIPVKAPVNVNPGNIGITINSTQDFGTVKISRGHKAQFSLLKGQSTYRYYKVSPSILTRLTAKIRFSYFDNELNDLKEPDLQVYSSTNLGVNWTRRGFTTKNAGENYVELVNLNPTAMFTLSSAAVFKKELNSLAGDGDLKLQLYPNPVDNEAVLSITGFNETRGTVVIFNSDGKIMLNKTVGFGEGNSQVNLSLGKLISGTYYLKLYSEDTEFASLPFVKN